MLDAPFRARLAPALDGTARRLAASGLRAGTITAAGLVVGVGACVAAAFAAWPLALALWLANRVLDGLDGPVARVRGGGTDLGGMLDFLADYVVYAGFVVGVAIAVPDARVACTALLATYLLNIVALLSFASLVAYAAFCVFPGDADVVAWVFAGMVLFTVGQRVRLAGRTLR